MMTGAASTGHRTQDGSNMMMLLSLKLILLAFFILLNSLADFEAHRAQAVLASVNQAFNGENEVAGDFPASSGAFGALPEVEAKMREVGSLFEAIVPLESAKSIRRANLVRIELPVETLFMTARARLRQGREILLARLAQSLRKGPKGAPRYLLEILVGTGSELTAGNAAPTGFSSLALRRAAVLAAHLSAAGAPIEGLSTGLLPGAPDNLRFVVRLRPQSAVDAGADGSGG